MPTIAELRNEDIPETVRHEIARKAMNAHFWILHAKGKTHAASNPEQFYGFRPEDVVEIHFHKQGFGKGLWYRLHDGRVISAIGKPSNPERFWYGSKAH
jgi:hypothetical protein